MDTRTDKPFRLVDHHSVLVLPFGFDDPNGVIARIEASPRWLARQFRADDPVDSERTSYFLPYIRRLLFPTMSQPGIRTSPVESSCRHYVFHNPLLTGSDAPFAATLVGRDNQDDEDFRCPFRAERIELLIFPFEVGFLILDLRCTEADATYVDQMKLLGMARMIAPMYLNQTLPVFEAGERKFHVPQFVAYLLAELEGENSATNVPTTPNAPTKLPVRLINDERMVVYAFSCLDRKHCPRDPSEAEAILRKRSLMAFDKDSAKQARNAKKRGLGPWQRVRWQAFGKDGGQLVAFACEAFDEKYLGHYHRTYYFDVFLLATMQRVALLRLYERLADIPSLTTGSSKSRKVLSRLRHDLLLFKNQCCFSQVTLRERGLQLWRRWQETFENETLLKEVNEQSSELEQYLRTQSRERMEWLLRLGGFVATVVPLLLSLEVILGKHDWVTQLKYILLTLVIFGTGLVALWVAFRRPKFE